MQKFVLLFLILGSLTALFYFPAPMDQLENGLENVSLIYPTPVKQVEMEQHLPQYRASNEAIRPLDSIAYSWATKKN